MQELVTDFVGILGKDDEGKAYYSGNLDGAQINVIYDEQYGVLQYAMEASKLWDRVQFGFLGSKVEGNTFTGDYLSVYLKKYYNYASVGNSPLRIGPRVYSLYQANAEQQRYYFSTNQTASDRPDMAGLVDHGSVYVYSHFE